MFSHLANVGDAKSLVIHPATTTHYRMSDEDLKKAGITAGTVRLSIGLEDAQDLIDDLDRALKALRRSEFRGRRAGGRSPIPPRTSSTRRSPRVVFVHGAGLDHSSFGLQSRYFGYHGRNVLALDLPGARAQRRAAACRAFGAMADWVSRRTADHRRSPARPWSATPWARSSRSSSPRAIRSRRSASRSSASPSR